MNEINTFKLREFWSKQHAQEYIDFQIANGSERYNYAKVRMYRTRSPKANRWGNVAVICWDTNGGRRYLFETGHVKPESCLGETIYEWDDAGETLPLGIITEWRRKNVPQI